jgi:hypothetical protein
MITGKWADISKAKSPALRGLSSRQIFGSKEVRSKSIL